MSPKLRTDDAAYCVRCSRKTLQAWLDQGKVELDGGYGRAWSSFTLHDIAVLAITVELTNLNFPVRAAFRIARYAVAIGRKDLFPRARPLLEAGEEFHAGWEDTLMTVRRGHKADTWEVTRWKYKKVVAPTIGNFFVVDVRGLVMEAMKRARERLAKKGATTISVPHKRERQSASG